MRKHPIILFLLLLLNSCVGSSTSGVFGTGVSVALDPRTLGTQIDDSIMQKNLQARLILDEKKYFVKISVKVLDGRIFLGGKVDKPEEKLNITKKLDDNNDLISWTYNPLNESKRIASDTKQTILKNVLNTFENVVVEFLCILIDQKLSKYLIQIIDNYQQT